MTETSKDTAPRSSIATRPADADLPYYTDKYFLRTKAVVETFGDRQVTYAVFMRRPVIFTPRLAVDWLTRIAAERGTAFDLDFRFEEGDWVGAGEPMLYITGSFVHLVDLETVFLQKIGAACVAAYNAYTMCIDLPEAGFLAMDARHCAGADMAELMAYAASVGSDKAKRKGATGFVGCATDHTAPYFGEAEGRGTMPHALIGYAGSTLRAAEMFHETFPDSDLIVLVDYFAREISDSLAVCRRFPKLAEDGRIGLRLDTHGGRFVEGLDTQASYAVLNRHAPEGRPRLPHRRRTALPDRYRRLGGGGVAPARATRPERLSAGQDRRLVGVLSGQMQGHGLCPGADRCGRHRLLSARQLVGDLRHRRYRRLRRRAESEDRARIPAARLTSVRPAERG